MAELTKVDVVIHPLRLQIMQTLTRGPLTTQEIADELPRQPKSSIYRHLKILLDAEMIQVVETRVIKGKEERVYALAQAPHINADDITHATAEDHRHMFTMYVVSLMSGFSEYLDSGETPDLVRDRVGLSEFILNVTQAELDEFSNKLKEALIPLLNNPAGEGRYKHKFALISHPISQLKNGLEEPK